MELDCGRDDPTTPEREGLIYCSSGNPPSTGPFPDCCDPDGDGFGTLPPPNRPRDVGHGATAAQVKTGDVVIQHFTTGGDESQCPPPPAMSNPNCTSVASMLQYVFTTVPALASYRDTTMAAAATLPYPNQVGGGGELPVSAPAGQDVVVTLTFWRPQRRPITGEPGYSDPPTAWTDIGGLNYSANGAPEVSGPGPPPPSSDCPQSAFSSGVDDPTGQPLTPRSAGGPGGFTDVSPDRPAGTANTFTYTLNLTQCLTSSWDVGEVRGFHFTATPPGGGGFADHGVRFKRQ